MKSPYKSEKVEPHYVNPSDAKAENNINRFSKEDFEEQLHSIAQDLLKNTSLTDSQTTILEGINNFKIPHLNLTLAEFIQKTLVDEIRDLNLIESLAQYENITISILFTNNQSFPSHGYGIDGYNDIITFLPLELIKNLLLSLGDSNYTYLAELQRALVHETYHIFQRENNPQLYDLNTRIASTRELINIYEGDYKNTALSFLSSMLHYTYYLLSPAEVYTNVRTINVWRDTMKKLPVESEIYDDFLKYSKSFLYGYSQSSNKARHLKPLADRVWNWLKKDTFENAAKSLANLEIIEDLVHDYEIEKDEELRSKILIQIIEELDKGFERS